MARITILDGGMGRELKRMGAPFRQPEWSALALMDAPDSVRRAHDAFIASGAAVITTNSYAVVPFHIGAVTFAGRGAELAGLAGRIAREAAAAAPRPVRVAGSLPPALGSYRPDLFDRAESIAIHRRLITGLAHFVDLWLAETQSSIAEIEAAFEALGTWKLPVWISFTLADEPQTVARQPCLRSGEAVATAVTRAIELGAAAILFNCSQPEVMGPALAAGLAARDAVGSAIPFGVYANAFAPQPKDAKANEGYSALRPDLTDRAYLAWTLDWVAAGAEIVGGCCGVGPEHIAAIAEEFAA
jgi:homocysteine S-methyltransferase